MLFGHRLGVVKDIDATYVNGVNQDVDLILKNNARVTDLERLKYDVISEVTVSKKMKCKS